MHTHAHAHAHAHACTHIRMHTHSHARTHTHTHKCMHCTRMSQAYTGIIYTHAHAYISRNMHARISNVTHACKRMHACYVHARMHASHKPALLCDAGTRMHTHMHRMTCTHFKCTHARHARTHDTHARNLHFNT